MERGSGPSHHVEYCRCGVTSDYAQGGGRAMASAPLVLGLGGVGPGIYTYIIVDRKSELADVTR